MPAYLDEWQQILDCPWPEVAAFITSFSDEAVRLRQSSPFAGVLTSKEREQVYDAFRGAIADDNELIIIGSQSILAQFPDAPAALPVSMEADLYPKNKPELADLVDGSIGEGSFFHELRPPAGHRVTAPFP